MPYKEIFRVIDELKDKFPGNSYDLIRKNCNTFTNCVCEAILGKSIPGFVNRMAKMGKFFYEINDFIMMVPYLTTRNMKYVQQTGSESQEDENVFDSGSGVQIG